VQVAVPLSSLGLLRTPPRSTSRGADLGTAPPSSRASWPAWPRLSSGCAARGARTPTAPSSLRARRRGVLSPVPILVEDNLAYYALARSAVLDGDLDRWNEFTELNQTLAYAPDNRGPMDPAFGSLFRVPFVALAHVLVLCSNALSFRNVANGFSFPYLFVTALGDFLAVLIGCLACFSLVEAPGGSAVRAVRGARRGRRHEPAALHLCVDGSSFQPSFLLCAIFLDHWDRTRDARNPAGWLGSGVLLA